MQEKLLNTNSAVYVLVVIWWIVCLWIDEPGSSTNTTAEIAPASSATEIGDA
jgi:hypothetical protein